MKRHARWCIVMIVGVLTAGAATAQKPLGHYAGDSVVRGSIGVFSPDGDSAYWDDKELDFTATMDDYEDVTFSLDYLYFVSPRLGLLFSIGGWEGKATQSYRDFVDEFGAEIAHVTSLDTAWIDVGLVFHLLGERAPLMPYLGAGGSLVSWELIEEGEFIDFGVRPAEVIVDQFFAEGDGFGFFLLAGVEVPITDNIALFAEGRWRDADDELNRDFAGFGALDVSGRSVSGGLSFRF